MPPAVESILLKPRYRYMDKKKKNKIMSKTVALRKVLLAPYCKVFYVIKSLIY